MTESLALKPQARGLLAVMAACILLGAPALAEMSAIERETVVRRACEAAIWGMLAVGIYDVELSLQRDAGARPGVVAYMSAIYRIRSACLRQSTAIMAQHLGRRVRIAAL